MPYIICVNQPGYLPESDPTAVATLEEAREMATDEWRRNATHDGFDLEAAIADSLPESGGVIGPLPDGYVIDVQRLTWQELAQRRGLDVYDPELDRGAIIDAYNDRGD